MSITPVSAPTDHDAPPGPEPMPARGQWPPFPWNPPDLDNPLIGRDEALEELTRAFDDVVRDWVVRVHLVVSDYGLGKSRLMSAFMAAARERAPETACLEVRCPSTGSGPYRLWDAVIRRAFEVPTDADAVEAVALVRRGAERYLPPEVAALVAQVVGGAQPEGDDEAAMARVLGAVGRLFEALAFERPLLVVVDDANRASARDFALSSALTNTVKARPVLLILTGSPNLADHLPGWERLPVTRLPALKRHEADRMLRLFLTGLVAPPSLELVERILSTAAGNSYAIKAMVRWILEAGGVVEEGGRYALDEARIAELTVPETLEGVIHARIHALTAREREVLAQAAVIGREFWLGALVAIARTAEGARPLAGLQDGLADALRGTLKKLVAARFIETRPTRFRGEEGFGFRSSVHQEAALEATPQTTLRRWHRVTLNWLEVVVEGLEVEGAEARAGGLRGAYLRELARHAEGADDPGLAARYALAAARHALAEGHSRAALTALETALRLAQPEQLSLQLKVLHDLGEVNALAGATDLAVAYFQDALDLAFRLGDRRGMAVALRRLADVEGARGNFHAARTQLMDALRLTEQIHDPHGVAAACVALGRLHWLTSEFDQALRVYKKAEHLYRRLGDAAGIGEVLHAQGAVHYDRGDVGLAERFYEEALGLRRGAGDKRGVVRTLNNLAAVWMTRRTERAVAVWQEALSVAQELSDLALQATLSDNLGEALALIGRHDEAQAMLERSIELAEVTGRRHTLVDALRNLGVVHTARGDWARAKVALDRASEEAGRLGLTRLSALVLRAHGDLAMARIETTGVIRDAEGPLTALAEDAYRGAGQRLEDAGYDLEAAVSWERLADALTLAGRRDEATMAAARARSLRADHLDDGPRAS